MCGFAGEFVLAPPGVGALSGPAGADVSAAENMAAAIVHRGPDDYRTYRSPDGRFAVAFRRLAIIDPAGSAQPMSTPDGQITVAFNGEIYNYQALRASLRADGAVLTTEGDTEVLLHLYRRHGAEMVSHLTGMFAFILYDSAHQTLLMARDRLGEKPLWYTYLPDRLVFASESGALLCHPKIDKAWDPVVITYYFTMGYIPQPRTAWAHVRKLPPGSHLAVTSAPVDPTTYWTPRLVPTPQGQGELLDLIRTKLSESVAGRLHADVPVGVLLSGGIDSAVVAALICRAAGQHGGVRTFTAGFADGVYDERPGARLVADALGTDHTELLVQPASPGVLDEILGMYGEPFADSSALPMHLICRAAREHVKVAIVGDGGDEVFGGYDRYRAIHLSTRLGPLSYLAIRLAAAALRPWASHEERSRLRRLARFAELLPHSPPMQYLMSRCLFRPADLPRLLTDDFAAGLDLDEPAEWFCNLYERPDLADEVARCQWHDLATYLPDDLLVKTDIASMRASLEVRAPMLDHELVCLGLSLPAEMKVTARFGKAMLRRAFRELLPRQTVRQRKRGFGIPLRRWLRTHLLDRVTETLNDRSLYRLGILRPEAVAGLLNDHYSGRADHSHRIWALLVFAHWAARQG